MLHAARMAQAKAKAEKLTAAARDELVATLKARFENNTKRHAGVKWNDVEDKLRAAPDVLQSLLLMESTGGEPDVVVFDKKSKALTFVDCAADSPKGRRSICYDRAALNARKENKPASSAEDLAAQMGVELLTEEEYRTLQTLGEFDLKTSSWVQTPAPIRKLGGALFCDRRFDTVFTYHNGAESYYAGRAFRGVLRF